MIPTRVRILLGAVLLGVACTGCLPQAPEMAPFVPAAEQTTPAPRNIVVIGDSLAAEGEPVARATWATVPNTALSYQAKGGTQFQHWMPRYPNIPQGSVVFALLGTNDITALNYLPLAEAKAETLAALDAIGDTQPECVVWFRLNTWSAKLRSADFHAKTLAYNAWMADEVLASGEYPWLRIYNWNEASWRRDDFLRLPADPIHHTDLGHQAYANAQVEALGLCSDAAA
jgi:hypothetical protein